VKTMREERGFSLIELMVVVAIIGTVSGLAVMAIKSDPTAKTAREIAALVAQARRFAIQHGAVRADVKAATSISATEMLRFKETTYGSKVELFDLTEGSSATATWVSSGWTWVPNRAKIYGVATTANSSGGETLPTAFAVNSVVDIFFFPDGTVGSSNTGSAINGATVYLSTRTGSKPDKFRVFIMPLSGIATTTKGW